jgi:hypothetical protein
MNVVYVRFDKNLDYKAVMDSFCIKKFLETVFGEFPEMISPTKFKFDRDVLAEFVQDEYDMSKEYVVDVKKVPEIITNEYYKTIGEEGEPLTLVEFETELLLDDHIVTVNNGDKVLGVFATETDFGHIIDEL